MSYDARTCTPWARANAPKWDCAEWDWPKWACAEWDWPKWDWPKWDWPKWQALVQLRPDV
jgi:hypothetical protein